MDIFNSPKEVELVYHPSKNSFYKFVLSEFSLHLTSTIKIEKHVGIIGKKSKSSILINSGLPHHF